MIKNIKKLENMLFIYFFFFNHEMYIYMSAIGVSQCIRNTSFLCPLLCHLMSCIFAISCIIFAYHVACAALQKV